MTARLHEVMDHGSGNPDSPPHTLGDARPEGPGTVVSFAVPTGEGTPLQTPTGGSITIKAHTRNTFGSMTVCDFTLPPRQGPGLHVHIREDEIWYVLEGLFRIKPGDAMFQLSSGGLAFGPRGTPHTFQNLGDAQGRLLVVTTPSGVERFFEEFAQLPGPVDTQTLAALMHEHYMELVGPPLAVSDPL